MNRFVVIILLGLVSIFAESVLLWSAVPSYLSPHILIVLVAYLAFFEVGPAGSVTAFVLGLMMDLSSAFLLGPWAGACVAVYGCLAVLSHRLFIESALVACVVGFAGSLGADVLYHVISYEFRPAGVHFLVEAIPRAAITAVLAPLLFSCFRKVMFRKSQSSRRASPAAARGA